MTAIRDAGRVYSFAGQEASVALTLAGVPRAPDRRRLITLSSAGWLPHYPYPSLGLSTV